MVRIWRKIHPGWRRIIIVMNFPILFILVIGLLELITKNELFAAAIALVGVIALFIKVPLLGVVYWIYDGFRKSKKSAS